MKTRIDPTKLRVYSESRRRRTLVGELRHDPTKGLFEFTYDEKYRSSKNAIPVGHELSLFKRVHTSGKLFPSFADRIPPRSNPAYKDYCRAVGISPSEKNPIVLLTTVGKKGPSTFIFEPVSEVTSFSGTTVLQFRKDLGLSRHEFAQAFGLNIVTVSNLERGKTSSASPIRFIEVLLTFPEVAIWQLERTGRNAGQETFEKLRNYFEKRLQNKLSE